MFYKHLLFSGAEIHWNSNHEKTLAERLLLNTFPKVVKNMLCAWSSFFFFSWQSSVTPASQVLFIFYCAQTCQKKMCRGTSNHIVLSS